MLLVLNSCIVKNYGDESMYFNSENELIIKAKEARGKTFKEIDKFNRLREKRCNRCFR